MAVADARTRSGDFVRLIATSEPRGYVRRGVHLESDEVLVHGDGHAERDIIDYAAQHGLAVTAIGATRPICLKCADAIRADGDEIVTRVRFD